MTDIKTPEEHSSTPATESRKEVRSKQFEAFAENVIPSYTNTVRSEKHRIEADHQLLVYQSGVADQIFRVYFAPQNPSKVRHGYDSFTPVARALFNKKANGDGYELAGTDRHGEEWKQQMDITFFGTHATVGFPLLGRSVEINFDREGNFQDLGSNAYSLEWEHEPGAWNLTRDDITDNTPKVSFDQDKDVIEASLLPDGNIIRLSNRKERDRPPEVIDLDGKLESGELLEADLTREQQNQLDFFGMSSNPKTDEVTYLIPTAIDVQKIREKLTPEYTRILDDPYTAEPGADNAWLHANIIKVLGITIETPHGLPGASGKR